MRIDLKVGFACNNKCVFCVQGNKRTYVQEKSFADLCSILEKNKNRADGVVFTGGDPTIRHDFLELVRCAKKNSYKIIQIQTNGRMLAYFDFCKKSIEAGANDFCISIHGSTGKIHDFLTGAKESFSQTVLGIKNLTKLGVRVSTNTVITKTNYRNLPSLANLLILLNVSQYQFAFPHIIHSADVNKEWLIPRKSTVMKYVKKALSMGEKAGIRVMTEAIPYCLMAGFEKCVAEGLIPPSVVYDNNFIIKDYNAYRKNEAKSKRLKCRTCVYYPDCEGPWKEYPEMFGWNEFKPVKHKS